MGVSLADDAIIGITQRIVRGPPGLAAAAGPAFSASQLPCFHPIPESQPVLPCLLRRCAAPGWHAAAPAPLPGDGTTGAAQASSCGCLALPFMLARPPFPPSPPRTPQAAAARRLRGGRLAGAPPRARPQLPPLARVAAVHGAGAGGGAQRERRRRHGGRRGQGRGQRARQRQLVRRGGVARARMWAHSSVQGLPAGWGSGRRDPPGGRRGAGASAGSRAVALRAGHSVAHAPLRLRPLSAPGPPSLLVSAAALVRHFPTLFAEVVVSAATRASPRSPAPERSAWDARSVATRRMALRRPGCGRRAQPARVEAARGPPCDGPGRPSAPQVSVARKTDAALWPPLFSAVGSPSGLLEGLVEAGELASAACFLLIIDRWGGAPAARRAGARRPCESTQACALLFLRVCTCSAAGWRAHALRCGP